MKSLTYNNVKIHSTRYRGSKRKIIAWIFENIKELEFQTALDAFGGTGVVGYMLKSMGKQVTYNDNLKFNYYIGKSLIENDFVTINESEIDKLLDFNVNEYPRFIETSFPEVFYLPEENKWLDSVIYNINSIWPEHQPYKREIAFNALFQSCLIKRPYNLFHRKNLNIRTANVNRTFGNKIAWDSTFEYQFRKFIDEINAHVFSNGEKCNALNEDIYQTKNYNYDLVYIDPPYIQSKGSAESSNYLNMYHFLEGMSNYSEWINKIDWNSKIRQFKENTDTDTVKLNKLNAEEYFCKIIEKFRDSIIVISYQSGGVPSVERIKEILYSYKKNVTVKAIDYKYVLNKNSVETCKEVLFIAK